MQTRRVIQSNNSSWLWGSQMFANVQMPTIVLIRLVNRSVGPYPMTRLLPFDFSQSVGRNGPYSVRYIFHTSHFLESIPITR